MTEKKKTIKSTPAKKTVTKPDSKVLPSKKPKKHVKIQTAEGWKREMMKKQKVSK